MPGPRLTRYESCGVTLLGDSSRPGGVTLAFTERTGGVSTEPFASLNLGSESGDDASAVAENRRRVLEAIGAEASAEALICPKQVHGDHVVVVSSADSAALSAGRAEAEAGADAVVCTAFGVPVLLHFADCVPVILACEGGFAVVHSGWRGTIVRIAAKAAGVLSEATGQPPSAIWAYVGPHIGQADYEVSSELAERFAAEFGEGVVSTGNHLDLGAAVVSALVGAGVPRESIVSCEDSTASNTERFYSYRSEGPASGRHGAIAILGGEG